MKYRKKPIVIDAIQFLDDVDVQIQIQEMAGLEEIRISYKDPDNPVMLIPTLEGVMAANVGDYIIRGVKGEIYPCKPDIFEASYTAFSEDITIRVSNAV